ncbi:TlpA family protein disulfide reductase [Agrilutibacter solisilvae]|uniref:TlpA family protein disulfide reductase n=1 Tax=Agrilutibacter solisilvae TaxID=2763317 RepID=A0A974Y2X2_9GAMM|nr:TlpA disulfide reductase family protein [Lysobacter solisilvae]QSX79470.1 TlpA family protein disulfide reductase [Lysobacter solisilvae]
MKPTVKVLLVAVAAGVLGAAAGLWFNGPGPLLRSELGQRALHEVLEASAPAPPAGVPVAERGGLVPSFSLPDLAGRNVSVPAAWSGRPVLVNLWASWCGPCIREMPELDRFATRQGATGVQVIGIALDEREAVLRFLESTPVGYPILLDTPGPGDAGVRLGNPSGVLPYTALIDARGRLVKEKIGPFEAGEVEAWLD